MASGSQEERYMKAGTVLQWRDKAGSEVAVGDIIVYGSALGKSASLQYGLVVGEIPNTTQNPPAATKLHVIGFDHQDNWLARPKRDGQTTEEWLGSLNLQKATRQKPSFICFPSRTIKLRHEQVSIAVLALVYDEMFWNEDDV